MAAGITISTVKVGDNNHIRIASQNLNFEVLRCRNIIISCCGSNKSKDTLNVRLNNAMTCETVAVFELALSCLSRNVNQCCVTRSTFFVHPEKPLILYLRLCGHAVIKSPSTYPIAVTEALTWFNYLLRGCCLASTKLHPPTPLTSKRANSLP